tara:strand:+ start:10210 stop:11382 length:1173 start_codon:yes stop_codon:yes gene_type:complete
MEIHTIFLALGALLLVGLVADEVGRRTNLPRVTLLILAGVALGPSGLAIIPAAFHDLYEFLASAALTMVAFLLGGTLTRSALRAHGKGIVLVSLCVVILTVLCVAGGLMLFGVPVIMALLLAGIATATEPAATQDAVRQLRAKGPFSDLLLGVVAVDDAWGLIAFSLLLVAAKAIAGEGGLDIMTHAIRELGGACVLGAAIGLPAAFLTGRLKPGEPMQTEAIAVVFLCAGLAIWLDVSFLLVSMIAGVIVTNLAQHHNRPFHEIENIEWPFMILFFVLAGASLHVQSLQTIGLIGCAYILLRTLARFIGGWLGATLSGEPPLHRRWIGFALVPQAGVALGMALVATNHYPQMGETVLAITVATTIVFEVAGPILAQVALRKTGQAHPDQ